MLRSLLLFFFGFVINASSAFSQEAAELTFWNSINDSKDAARYQIYLKKYPKGHYKELAALRIRTFAKKTFEIGSVFKDCEVCPLMVVAPGGSFMMGSPKKEKGRTPSEGPLHKVTIAKPFAVGKYEITFDEWDACVADGGCNGYKPSDSGWSRGKHPVINVSWLDAQAYVEWLNGKVPDSPYKLLSEAEWEYAARAGTQTAYPFGNEPKDLCQHGNSQFGWANRTCDDGYKRTAPVGKYPANAFGLHDMLGNVFEWVEDCNHADYTGAPKDGSVWVADCNDADDGEFLSYVFGRGKIKRGSSWAMPAIRTRSAWRGFTPPENRGTDTGFRISRTLD